MSNLLVIAGMALVTFLPRWLGFALAGIRIRPFWLRFFRFVPIAVFPALIVPEIAGVPDGTVIRAIAAIAAAVAVWRTHRLWFGIVAGMGVFWLLRAFWS